MSDNTVANAIVRLGLSIFGLGLSIVGSVTFAAFMLTLPLSRIAEQLQRIADISGPQPLPEKEMK